MRSTNHITALVAILFTAGCSGTNTPVPPAVPPPPAKTVFDPLTRQLDKARAVQQTVDQNSERTRNAADNPERGEPPQ